MGNNRKFVSKWVSPDSPGVYCFIFLGIRCPLNIQPWYTWLDIWGWWRVMFLYAYFPSALYTPSSEEEYEDA